jgi:outer membrane scaffolding protein for murein synthesis (MipA/OmpV family)
MNKFKMGVRVNVAECYLTDEVNENTDTTPTATVHSEPIDDEESVYIQYENGLIDIVPQDILEIIE